MNFLRFGWRHLLILVLGFILVIDQIKGQSSVPKQGDTVTIEANQDNSIFNKFGNGFYTGSRVGPLYLFRSSAKNAEIVREGFRGQPILKSFGLALGDEFPNLRDDLVAQKVKSKKNGLPVMTLQQTLSALSKRENWKFDLENNKKEKVDPFMRPTRVFINSLRDNFRQSDLFGGSTTAPTFRINIHTPVRKSLP